MALDISKAFGRVWRAGLLHKRKSYVILGQIFGLFLLFSVIDGFEWFWMESLHKNIQLMLRVPQGSILGPKLFLLYINDLPDNVICDIAIYADNIAVYSKCGQASDLMATT